MAPRKIDPRIERRIKELKANAKTHLAAQEFEDALNCLDLAIDLNTSSFKVRAALRECCPSV